MAFFRLVALIEQLKTDRALASKLLEHGFGNDRTGDISVMKWIEVYKKENRPVWRLKSWDMERRGLSYRLIYCYNYPDQSYNIMAIVPRKELDYDDPSHPIRQRVINRIKADFPNA